MRARSFSIWAIPIAAIASIGSWSLWQPPARRTAPAAAQETAAEKTSARLTKFKVIRVFPHDRNAFTQGLLWHDGTLFESTGIEGRSEVRRVDLATGRVLQKQKLPADVFGEGLVLSRNRLIQITLQSQRAFVFDSKTFKSKGEWKYKGEGWGLTTDGEELIMSDGSSQLLFRDPKTFAEKRRVAVTFNGKPLAMLNELEWIDGQVWANVWQTDYIVRINPQSGAVEEYLDCTGLLGETFRTGKEDVLNGIAYDSQAKRIFLTGKLWPRLFQIQLQD